MKKKICLFIFLLFSLSSYAQDKNLIIYVDASIKVSEFSMRNKIASALQDSEYKVLLFISNNKQPLYTKNVYESSSILDKLSKVSNSAPHNYFDIDTLNRLFSLDSMFSEVSLRADHLKEKYVFYFFFNAEQSKLLKQDIYLARALLLSNRLMDKKGFNANVQAKIFLQSMDQKKDSLYVNALLEEDLFEVELY